MKKLSMFAAIAVAMLVAQASLAQPVARFTDPILIGGDSGTIQTEMTRSSTATHHKFFQHPESAAGSVNFVDVSGLIELPLYNPITVHDVTATPGMIPEKMVDVGHGASLDNPPSRGGNYNPHNGISPDDFTIKVDPMEIRLGFNRQLAEGNSVNHRLVMADVRNEVAADEFKNLFGVDPLEEGLIGNAAGNPAVPPYDTVLNYPAAIVHGRFQWCAPIPTLVLGTPIPLSWKPCNNELPAIGPSYDEVFLYDIADIGTGLISTSYDTFLLNAKEELGISFQNPPISLNMWMDLSQQMNVPFAYVSPLTFFRRTENPPVYKFSGYVTWQFPNIVLGGGQNNMKREIYKFLFVNPIWPMHTNPIAVDAIDLKGASSGKVLGHPDTDLGVAHQSTLFAFSNWVFNLFGQPHLFGDHNYHVWGDVLGKCAPPGAQCNDALFVPISGHPEIFPDDVVASYYFWKQVHEWGDPNCVGAKTGPYECMNPSHVVDPSAYAFTGPAMFDAATLTDTVGGVRKQYALVPSGGTSATPDGSAGLGVVYMIDPDGQHFWMRTWKRFCKAQGAGINAGGPTDPFDPADDDEWVHCLLSTQYEELPVILPEAIPIHSPKTPSTAYVPYQIRTGNLDGNTCEDFTLTWRAKATETYLGDHVRFFDIGEQRMFSEYVTVVLRHEQNGACTIASIDHKKVQALDPLQKVEVASAAIGDFKGDGTVGIMAGNVLPEAVGDGTFSSYAYLLAGPGFSGANVERVRTGFRSEADQTKIWGVGQIEADDLPDGPEAFAQKNSLPLMLPEIGCQGENEPAVTMTPVSSIFEIYHSIGMNTLAQAFGLVQVGNDYPFADAQQHPRPQRCGQKGICEVDVCTSLADQEVEKRQQPLWAGTSCCMVFCEAPVELHPLDATTRRFVNPCLQYLCMGKIDLNLPEYTGLNKDFCQQALMSCTEVQACGIGFAQLDRDDGQSGDDTDFAVRFREDEVHGPDRGAIVDMRDLAQAEIKAEIDVMEGSEYAPTFTSRVKNLDIIKSAAKISQASREAKALQIKDGIAQTYNIPTQSLEQIDPAALVTMWDAIRDQIGEEEDFSSFWTMPELALVKLQKYNLTALGGENDAVKSLPTSSCSLIIREAQAQPPPPPVMNYKDLRLPKGLTWTGEMTAVVHLTPKTCNYNGVINADIGEQCDTAQLTEVEAAAQLAAVCTAPPSGGTPFNCDMRDCSCAYQQPQCVGVENVQCWNDTQCPVGQSCTADCFCSAPGQALANDCTVHCMGYSSNEMKDYIATHLNKPLQEAAKRPDYEFYCQPEERVAVICHADDVLTADGGVLSGNVYQLGGSVLADYIHNPGTLITTLEQPVQLLPAAGKTLQIWKGTSAGVGEISADLGLSGAVPMSSVDSSYTITAGASSFDINNGIFQYEVHPTTAGQSFSISSGVAPLNVSSTANGAFFVSYIVTQPACGMFTQAGLFQENCEVGNVINPEEIRKHIEAKAVSGPVTGADFADLPPSITSQTYYYRYQQNQAAMSGPIKNLKAAHNSQIIPMARGMSCGCNTTGLAPALGEILSSLLAAIAVGGGLLAGRRRMKRK